MALTFSDLLRKAGIDPGEVRLLRHQDASADPGRSPFALWRTDPAAFVEYHLKSREPSDYQIAVLEVAGSEHSREEIIQSEHRWMRKLQSVAMGLNS